jgi:mono/diheme cytochrome c family protein
VRRRAATRSVARRVTRLPSRATRAAGALALAALIAMLPLRADPAQDYMLYCMGCHGAEARGVPGKVPPLAITLGRFMRTPEGRNYVLRVPGAANSVLSDAQLAAVLNWLAGRYGAAHEPQPLPFSASEVARARHVPLADALATRRAVVRSLAATGPAPAADY